MYSEKVLERFRNPKNAGEISDANGVGEVGNLVCGDVIKVFIKVKEGRIEDVKFQTYGCVAAIAASDMLCELAKGKTLDEVLALKYDDITDSLGGSIPPVKFHCSMMGIKALKKAVEEYRKKEKL